MDANRMTIIGLVCSCPVTQGNPAGCLFHDIRLMPMPDRVAWANALTQDEVDYLVGIHHACRESQA